MNLLACHENNDAEKDEHDENARFAEEGHEFLVDGIIWINSIRHKPRWHAIHHLSEEAFIFLIIRALNILLLPVRAITGINFRDVVDVSVKFERSLILTIEKFVKIAIIFIIFRRALWLGSAGQFR